MPGRMQEDEAVGATASCPAKVKRTTMDIRRNLNRALHVAVVALTSAMVIAFVSAFASGCNKHKKETVWTGKITHYKATDYKATKSK